jgi:hypothetical protein
MTISGGVTMADLVPYISQILLMAVGMFWQVG